MIKQIGRTENTPVVQYSFQYFLAQFGSKFCSIVSAFRRYFSANNFRMRFILTKCRVIDGDCPYFFIVDFPDGFDFELYRTAILLSRACPYQFLSS